LTLATGLNLALGQTVTASDSGNAANNITGTVISYNPVTGALVIDVTGANGSGTPSGWNVAFASGSALNTSDSQTLIGHFGQYDEPIVLAMRATGNINFGTYTSPPLSSQGNSVAVLPGYLRLGTLSDGFSQYTDGLAQYVNQFGISQPGDVSLGAGASAWAALFDPAAPGAYHGMSGGLGASSATYYLTAGADLAAADPMKVDPNAASGTLTVAGVSVDVETTSAGTSFILTPVILGSSNTQFLVTSDPLYLYNFSWSGNNEIASPTSGVSNIPQLPLDWSGALGGTSGKQATVFADYASLVRTGTGNIRIATSKDLVLQSPLSLIYTAGTGYNVNGTVSQPLAGFSQYKGMPSIGSPSDTAHVDFDYLVPSTFPTHGGDLDLQIGGSIVGAMNAVGLTGVSEARNYKLEDLSYDMTALGSQLKLENWITQNITQFPTPLIGSFNSLYATGNWLIDLPSSSASFYTAGVPSRSPAITGAAAAADTVGNDQLAWFTEFPYLENTIGSFGGGNITVKVGGSVSNVQFVAPTNARDAGPYLAGSKYAYDPNVVQNAANVGLAAAGLRLTDPNDPFGNRSDPMVGGYTGLYVRGGGNVSVTTGGDISGVYTYVQNGTTTLQTGGAATGLILATATGDVSVRAIGAITIADQQVGQDIGNNPAQSGRPLTLSGISLIQNASILAALVPASRAGGATLRDGAGYIQQSVLTGILTSAPIGTLTLESVGTVTLDVSNTLSSPWNTNQGILPAQVKLISMGGDILNEASFTTYPDPAGTVDLLARGSVLLSAGLNNAGGFNLSDADPSVMPTLANIARVLAPFQTVATAADAASATLAPTYERLLGGTSGGANYLAGQDPGMNLLLDPQGGSSREILHATVLQGDSPAQLIPSLSLDTTTGTVLPDPIVEAERHAGLHAGDPDPARIIALDGDVAQSAPSGFSQIVRTTLPNGQTGFASNPTIVSGPYLSLTKAIEISAGRDVKYLSVVGQNNDATDITIIRAGRDVIYPTLSIGQSVGIFVGGPGDLLVQSGRNVDLGTSTGIQTFGNLLNTSLPSGGADITIETGLGPSLQPFAYAAFIAQYIDPTTAAANQFAESLQLFASDGAPLGSGAGSAFAYLQSLPPLQQQILLNRVFFSLLRDSGREHSGGSGGGNYEKGGSVTIDTDGTLNTQLVNYERAFAAIGTFLGGTSGSGDFLGGLSTVRTQGGGNITIMSPHGQIQVGLATPPTGFPGYALSNFPLWALNFGIVTERGGNVNLYAEGDVSVNQSRVFTLEGGDLTVVSLNGNIDAGKGAKTVQAIQPPTVSYDGYGNISITPFGPSSGSGLAVLRALPDVPLGNADLIAINGFVDAGDAGIRVSGNLNIAALTVLNAGNIQVGGKSTGVPTVEAPNIAALTSASNAAGAAAKTSEAPSDTTKSSDQPSIIIVEFLGFGGGDSDLPAESDQARQRRDSSQIQDPHSRVQVLGAGEMTETQRRDLVDEKRKLLSSQ
jgi:hypothetical protein